MTLVAIFFDNPMANVSSPTEKTSWMSPVSSSCATATASAAMLTISSFFIGVSPFALASMIAPGRFSPRLPGAPPAYQSGDVAATKR